MEKRVMAAVFLLLLAGMLILAGVETVAKSLGGTPLVILCYLVIGVVLGGYLLKIKKEEGETPEDENGLAGNLPEKNSEEFERKKWKGEEYEDL